MYAISRSTPFAGGRLAYAFRGILAGYPCHPLMARRLLRYDLNVVRLLCDRIIVVRSGRIIEEGPCEQVLSAPREAYARELAAIPHPPM